MRKLLLILISVFVLIVIGACANQEKAGEPLVQQAEDNEKSEDKEKEDNESYYEELFGYRFAFIDSVVHESRGHGYLGKAEGYDVIISNKDVISFSKWENVISDCEELFSDTVYSCLRYSGCKQAVSFSEQRTNGFGENILWVEGALEYEEGNLDYYAVYYITEEGKVTFAICIPNGEDSSRAKEAMECLADNLQKAE